MRIARVLSEILPKTFWSLFFLDTLYNLIYHVTFYFDKCSKQQPCHTEYAEDQAQRGELPCCVAVAVHACELCVRYQFHVHTAVSCVPAPTWSSDSCPQHCRQSVVRCPSLSPNRYLRRSVQKQQNWFTACWCCCVCLRVFIRHSDGRLHHHYHLLDVAVWLCF